MDSGSGSSPTAQSVSVQSFKLGQQRGRGLGDHDTLGFSGCSAIHTCCATVRGHFTPLSLRMGINNRSCFAGMLLRQVLGLGWRSMDTVPCGYCSRSAPFLTPKCPTNVASLFQFSRLSSYSSVLCCRLLPSTESRGRLHPNLAPPTRRQEQG